MRLEAPAREGPEEREAEQVRAWLALLARLMRLPEGKASGICEELECHLQERVRDLEVAGHGETQAVRIAIQELGDAAVLARRFRSASRWRQRRLTMNVAVVLAAAGAAVLSLIAVVQGPAAGGSPGAGVAVETFQPAGEGDGAPRLGDLQLTGAPLREVLETAAGRADLVLHIDWKRLEAAGLDPDTPVSVAGRDVALPDLLGRINESIDHHIIQLDHRIGGGVLEIADRELFDRRELTLAAYDLGEILARGMERHSQSRKEIIGELLGAIHLFVSPDDWRDNGGDLAQLNIVGDRLFVEAPRRFHVQIRWIIGQLDESARPRTDRATDDARADAGAARRSVKVYPLRHTAAADVAEAVRPLFPTWRIEADPRTNSIIVADPDAPTPAHSIQSLDRAGQAHERHHPPHAPD